MTGVSVRPPEGRGRAGPMTESAVGGGGVRPTSQCLTGSRLGTAANPWGGGGGDKMAITYS